MDGDDATLAVSAANGCRTSFETLAARYQVGVVHYLQRLLARRGGSRARSDADDVAQETFLRAYRNLHRYDPRRPFAVWLFTIARRACLNHLRAERRHALRAARAARATATVDCSDPEAAALALERRSTLWDVASRTLSERQFTAIWLRYVEDMPVGGIATVLGGTSTAVKLLLFRARRRLECTLRDAELPATGQASPPAQPLSPWMNAMPPRMS